MNARDIKAHELVLARHAESIWNVERRWQGQLDPPLSERGREQARALGRELAREGVRAIVASDLERARETARLAAAELGCDLELEPRLRELDVGDWGGLTVDEIAARWPEDLAQLRAGDLDLRPGGGESRRELRVRVMAALEAAALRRAGTRFAVVTHAGVVRTLLWTLRLDNAQWHRTDLRALRRAGEEPPWRPEMARDRDLT
jgi:broad specificity phosphatase PhoE